jgi:hypothetical protein
VTCGEGEVEEPALPEDQEVQEAHVCQEQTLGFHYKLFFRLGKAIYIHIYILTLGAPGFQTLL